MKHLFAACLIVAATSSLAAQRAPDALRLAASSQTARSGQGGARTPTVDEILSIKRVASPEISPDGRLVAYTVRETNWDDNAYETEIWLADASNPSAPPRQLTNGRKSSDSPAWAPDGSRIAFLSDRTDKRQIYVINPLAGEAEALTSLEDGVTAFAWAPDGRTIAYTATEPKSNAIKEREKKYGEFEVVDEEYRMTHLFTIDVASRATRTLTSGALTVGAFQWSPDGARIAFDHRVNNSPRAAAPPTSRSSPSPTRRFERSSPRRAPIRSRSGRPTGAALRSRPRWRTRPSTIRTPSSPSSLPPAARQRS